jgi:hypothetical protein
MAISSARIASYFDLTGPVSLLPGVGRGQLPGTSCGAAIEGKLMSTIKCLFTHGVRVRGQCGIICVIETSVASTATGEVFRCSPCRCYILIPLWHQNR